MTNLPPSVCAAFKIGIALSSMQQAAPISEQAHRPNKVHPCTVMHCCKRIRCVSCADVSAAAYTCKRTGAHCATCHQPTSPSVTLPAGTTTVKFAKLRGLTGPAHVHLDALRHHSRWHCIHADIEVLGVMYGLAQRTGVQYTDVVSCVAVST